MKERKDVDQTPCIDCAHISVCGHKQEHYDNVNALMSITKDFSDLDVAYIVCKQFMRNIQIRRDIL